MKNSGLAIGRVDIRRQGMTFFTEGLERSRLSEIQCEIEDTKLAYEARHFLAYLVEYMRQSGKTICAGETLNYGYWLVKFLRVNDNRIEVWEYDAQGTEFVRGASLALRYWMDQHAVCKRYHVLFQPPNAGSMTYISPGVLEGEPVWGMRPPLPDGYSGWKIFTSGTDEHDDVTLHHTYHVTAARPELARYLALPYGCRFDLRQGSAPPKAIQRLWKIWDFLHLDKLFNHDIRGDAERVYYNDTMYRAYLKRYFGKDDGNK